MKTKTYSIFGAGASGLYTAWRLLGGKTKDEKGKAKQLAKGDTLELYDWGKYDFSKENSGSRAPSGRVCTWHYQADESPDNGFNTIELLAGTAANLPQTRVQWCEFYQNGRIVIDLPESSVYKKGDLFKDIGYWNLMFDQLGAEGYSYTSDGNGYTSNVINWNAAVAIQSNNEFTPGTQYKTLTTGYSSMFNALFDAIVKLAKAKGVSFEYHPDTRLHSILKIKDVIHYSVATRKNPNKKSASKTTDAAWLAMPRHALELVAQATRYE